MYIITSFINDFIVISFNLGLVLFNFIFIYVTKFIILVCFIFNVLYYFQFDVIILFFYYSHTTKTTQWEDPRIQFRQQRAISDRIKPNGTLITSFFNFV